MTIEDSLLRRLRRLAIERRVPFKRIVSEALRAGLDVMTGRAPRKPFRQKTHDMGGARYDLEKALHLAGELENEELIRKQSLRK